MQQETIICTKCNKPKQKKDFARKDTNVSGINGSCKTCNYQRKLEIDKQKKKDEWWKF